MSVWAHQIMQWPLTLSVTIIVALSALVSLFAVRAVRNKWPHPVFKENNELVGFTYAVYGLIYGVLLAFTIVVAWQRFSDTEQLVMQETTQLSDLWRDSLAFPPAFRDNIHTDLIAYAQSVVDDEWPAMALLGRASPHTEAAYERLWSLTYHLKPETPNQQAYLGQFLDRMNELSATRRLRILHSTMEVNTVLWLVLWIGAVPTVAYTLLFSNRHAWVQILITGSIMMIVMLGLLVTLSLQYPFSGKVSIRPDAFGELLDSFRQRLQAESVSVGP